VPLVFFERSSWPWFNGISLVRFGFRIWEKNNNNDFYYWKFKYFFLNQVLERKINWGQGNNGEATLVILIVIFITQRNNIMSYYYVNVYFFLIP
jgi:hypothetical protein